MKEHLQYDDIFKQKLTEHESAVPEDMFDRLIQKRASSEESVDKILQHKLTEHDSDVPRNLFDRMMDDRESRWDSAEKIMQHRLNEHESEVSADMFDQMMFDRDFRPESVDKIMQHKLLQHESEVPADMFERIINERERRRPVAFWWQSNRFKGVVAALILAFLAGGVYWYNNKNQSTLDSTIAIDDNNETHTNKNSLNTEGVATSPQSNSTFNKTTENITTETNTTDAVIKKTEQNQIVFSSKKANTPKSNILSKTKTSKEASSTASNSTIITSNSKQPKTEASSLIDNRTSLPSTENSQQMAAMAERDKNTFIGFNPLAKRGLKDIIKKPLKHEIVANALPCPGPDYGCPTFGKKNSGKISWYIDAYGAPEYAIRSLKSLSPEFNEYRQARDTIERTLYAFGGGVRAVAKMESGLILRGGLVYSQNNERYKKDSLILDYVEYVIRVNPQTGQSDTTAVNLVDAIRRQIRYNRYRTFDFTVQAGYEFPLTDALTLGVNGGVNINILTRLKGTVLGQDLQPMVLTEGSTIYQTSVGTSLIGSVAGYWRFNEKMELMVEPQVRYFMRPITKVDYVLRQSYVNMGLNIGIRYKLF